MPLLSIGIFQRPNKSIHLCSAQTAAGKLASHKLQQFDTSLKNGITYQTEANIHFYFHYLENEVHAFAIVEKITTVKALEIFRDMQEIACHEKYFLLDEKLKNIDLTESTTKPKKKSTQQPSKPEQESIDALLAKDDDLEELINRTDKCRADIQEFNAYGGFKIIMPTTGIKSQSSRWQRFKMTLIQCGLFGCCHGAAEHTAENELLLNPVNQQRQK